MWDKILCPLMLKVLNVEMYDVIMHSLKQTLNCEIKNCGLVMNEIQYKQSLPHIKTVALNFFLRRKNRSKHREPDFFCPFCSKRGPICKTRMP